MFIGAAKLSIDFIFSQMEIGIVIEYKKHKCQILDKWTKWKYFSAFYSLFRNKTKIVIFIKNDKHVAFQTC